MFKRFANWVRAWDDELLAVLKDPSLAANVPDGYRREFANNLAELPANERHELYRFSSTYRGWELMRELLKFCLAFSVAGALVKLAYFPGLTLPLAILGANIIGLTVISVLMMVWFNQVNVRQLKRKTIVFCFFLGVLGGVYAARVTLGANEGALSATLDMLPQIVVGLTVATMLLVVMPAFALKMVRNRHFAVLAEQLKQEAEQERLARELSETQLRLLRAQIEPHFLFNTLGAVQQLAEQGAPRAAELTSHLIDFLRASMSEMRCEQVSLDTEFRLVDSYLRVMQIRMGERLRYQIDLPDALAATRVPSMLALTLAENAIKHGIEPSLAGGEIVVTAHDDGGTIRIRVRDSGVGMSDTPGAGTGLENVRHRLRLAYGEGACLLLSEAEPGLLAEIAVPCKEPT